MGKKILLVEDCDYSKAQLKTMLFELGHEVVAEASSGKDAGTFFVTSAPDVVILDIVLPDRSGLFVIKEIIKIKQDAKIIVCSSSNNELFIKQALTDGARAYIIKPVNKNQLKRELDAI